MKTFFLFLFAISSHLAFSQNITTESGMIKFNSIADYTYYADNPENRTSLETFTNAANDVSILSKRESQSDLEDIPDFLKSFLNNDNMALIGNYILKFDFTNKMVLVLNKNVQNAIMTLQNSDTTQAGVIVLYFESVGNGVEILEGLENGSINSNNYPSFINNTSDAEKCRHASTKKHKPDEVVWSTLKMNEHFLNRDLMTDCDGDDVDYINDYKMVYQRLVFYFKIECKAKNTTHCRGYNSWRHEVKKDIHIGGSIRYEVRCWGEQEKKFDRAEYLRVNTWIPYDGSRSLSRYYFTMNCQSKHTWESSYNHNPQLHIEDGY